MKMSWFSKNFWERSDGQTSMRKKNRIRRKKTRYILLVRFCKFVRAIFVTFGGIYFSYFLIIYLFF